MVIPFMRVCCLSKRLRRCCRYAKHPQSRNLCGRARSKRTGPFCCCASVLATRWRPGRSVGSRYRILTTGADSFRRRGATIGLAGLSSVGGTRDGFRSGSPVVSRAWAGCTGRQRRTSRQLVLRGRRGRVAGPARGLRNSVVSERREHWLSHREHAEFHADNQERQPHGCGERDHEVRRATVRRAVVRECLRRAARGRGGDSVGHDVERPAGGVATAAAA